MNNNLITPIKHYDNALINKSKILLENKGKSGIYRWINKLNNNSYVGSGLNLSKENIIVKVNWLETIDLYMLLY